VFVFFLFVCKIAQKGTNGYDEILGLGHGTLGLVLLLFI